MALPSHSVVGTPPSVVGGEGSIPGWGAKISHASEPKTKTLNRNKVVTNLMKSLKWSTSKKKKSFLKKKSNGFLKLIIHNKV